MNKIILFLLINLLFGRINAQNSFDGERKNLKSDVILQGYYWNSTPGGIWWDSLSTLSTELSSALFEGIWIPSPAKGSSGKFSMGYDIYDNYDFGNYFQQGTTETRFGSFAELKRMIDKYHSIGLKVYSDIVLGYVTGGEELQKYECSTKGTPDSSYLVFYYPNGSNRFKKDASFFYPNKGNCSSEYFKRSVGKVLNQKLEWLAFNKPFVVDSLINYGKYFIDDLNLDGFRIFEANYLDVNFIKKWGKVFSAKDKITILDYTGDKSAVNDWLKNILSINQTTLVLPDYELREVLSAICSDKTGGFDLSQLDEIGLINRGIEPENVLHFVETSEFDKTDWENKVDGNHKPFIGEKKFAYSYILFSEGKPSIFFRDYFINGYKSIIDPLIVARTKYLKGKTLNRYDLGAFYIRDDKNQSQTKLEKDIYISGRSESDNGTGAFLLMNDNPTHSFDVFIETDLPIGTRIKNLFDDKSTAEVIKPTAVSVTNKIKFTILPRTCSVFITDTAAYFNNPPVLEKLDKLTAYSGTRFYHQLLFSDANKDYLEFDLLQAPECLSINNLGELTALPTKDDLGECEIIVKLSDLWGASAIDTFIIVIKENTSPILKPIPNAIGKVAKRFEISLKAFDSDGDSLFFNIFNSPAWLKIGQISGIISGTPALKDTGVYKINVTASDIHGGADTVAFLLVVKAELSSDINTYEKPIIDGIVEAKDSDWRDDWLLISDNEEDGKLNLTISPDNDIYTLYATWDSDSIYFASEYAISKEESFIIYIDAGIKGGITNFNSLEGYLGDYPVNILFNEENSIDFLFVQNEKEPYNFFGCAEHVTISTKEKINCIINKERQSVEIAIAWEDIFGEGAGIIPAGAELNVVAVIAGLPNFGPIDTAPDNNNVDGSERPVKLSLLVPINPDINGDAIPDPTKIIYAAQSAEDTDVDADYKLFQNYPNPFNPKTSISFEIPRSSHVQLKVYDILGKDVATLVNKELKAGKHSFDFDATDLSAGTYFYRIKTGSFVEVRKMIYVK